MPAANPEVQAQEYESKGSRFPKNLASRQDGSHYLRWMGLIRTRGYKKNAPRFPTILLNKCKQ